MNIAEILILESSKSAPADSCRDRAGDVGALVSGMRVVHGGLVMAIALIYHHEKRGRADQWAAKLEKAGYEVMLAPLGFEVGSKRWCTRVFADQRAADAALVLWSEKSVVDEWVKERVEYAKENGTPLVPILIDPVKPPKGFRIMQYIDGTATDASSSDRVLSYLLDNLKSCGAIAKPRPQVLCFLSYSRTEREFVIKLASDLKTHRISVWRDEDDIRAGTSWEQQIQAALGNCTHVLLIATPQSVNAPRVLDECLLQAEKER